jgi:uncharacterized damage-inducible protein DinB
MTTGSHYLESVIMVFNSQKALADKAVAQLKDEELHYQPDPESNSIAIIIKHLAGNMISRWTDFLTSDGEKPYRNRDSEFEEGKESKEQLLARWEEGWKVFNATLDSLSEDDLLKTVKIRGEGLTVIQALNRQVSHYAYHTGQIVYLAKHIRSESWKSLSIPKGRSAEHMKGNYLQGSRQ